MSSFHKPRDENAEDYITERQEAIKKIQNTLCQHIEKGASLLMIDLAYPMLNRIALLGV